jgi:hypothetical protein
MWKSEMFGPEDVGSILLGNVVTCKSTRRYNLEKRHPQKRADCTLSIEALQKEKPIEKIQLIFSTIK